MAIQGLTIINLIYIYDNKPYAAVTYTVVYVLLVLILLSPLVSLEFLTLLELFSFPLSAGGKVCVSSLSIASSLKVLISRTDPTKQTNVLFSSIRSPLVFSRDLEILSLPVSIALFMQQCESFCKSFSFDSPYKSSTTTRIKELGSSQRSLSPSCASVHSAESSLTWQKLEISSR